MCMHMHISLYLCVKTDASHCKQITLAMRGLIHGHT